MRILITGACGFVGSTLARFFRESSPDCEVVGLDNFIRAGSESNRLALRQLSVKVVHGDIRNASDLESLPACDWILDCAANPSVLAGVDGKTSSRQLVEHNLGGTVNLLELAKAWRAGVTILSTSRVYSIRDLAAIPLESNGDRFVPLAETSIAGPSPAGIAEGFPTRAPISLYGATKLASEALAFEYGSAFEFPVFVNRCGVLAGAGQFGKIDQGIFSFWIHSYAQRRPLKYVGFNGAGHQVRDCLHARDLGPLLASQMANPGRDVTRILNVSGGLQNSASLRELSAWCANRFGEHAIAVDNATRPLDVPWLVLDAGAVQHAWNWQPQTSLLAIWSEIAEHAERNPHWLDASGDA